MKIRHSASVVHIPKDLLLGFFGQLLALRAFGVQPEVPGSGVGEFRFWLNSEDRPGIEANWLTCH